MQATRIFATCAAHNTRIASRARRTSVKISSRSRTEVRVRGRSVPPANVPRQALRTPTGAVPAPARRQAGAEWPLARASRDRMPVDWRDRRPFRARTRRRRHDAARSRRTREHTPTTPDPAMTSTPALRPSPGDVQHTPLMRQYLRRQVRAPGRADVVPHGRLLRAVLRRCAQGRAPARHHPDQARPVGRHSRSRWRACPTTSWKPTSRAWCAWASRWRSASRSAIRRWPRAWSSARWCAWSRPARSPTRRCWRIAATISCSRWHATAPASALAWLDLASGRCSVLEVARRVRVGGGTGQAVAGRVAGRGGQQLARRGRRAARGCAADRRGISTHDSATRTLTAFFGTRDLRGFGCDGLPLAVSAAGALLQYVKDTQRAALPHIARHHHRARRRRVAMDAATRRNLELDSHPSGRTANTPCWACSTAAVTPMGGRLLRRWLHRPLRDRMRVLRERHQAIDALTERCGDRAAAGAAARHSATSSASLPGSRCARRGRATCRPCAMASRCCRRSGALLADADSPRLAALLAEIGEHEATAVLLGAAVAEAATGAAARRRRDPRRASTPNSTNCARWRPTPTGSCSSWRRARSERTGIATLKVGYNRVHGYYIEVSRGQSERVPTHYIRRQTLKGAERYITEELKAFEDKVLSARERALMRENALYEQLLDTLVERPGAAAALRAALAELDVLANLAERALDRWTGSRRASTTSPASTSPRPPSGGRGGPRRTLRAQRPRARRRAPHAGHHRAQHGRQDHLHAPDRADRAAGPYRQLRARRRAVDRPDRPHLHPHRRRRRSRRRAVDLHGRDERDRQHPAQRHAGEPGADGRGRARHQHLRRAGAGLGLRGASWRPRTAPSPCSPPTTSS